VQQRTTAAKEKRESACHLHSEIFVCSIHKRVVSFRENIALGIHE
jgi:hypothetical protein